MISRFPQGATPDLPPPRPRLTAAELATAELCYPKVLIGNDYRCVDAIGLVSIGRYWPLSHVPSDDEIDVAYRWLGRVARIYRPGTCSYRLKHFAERWSGAYVCNGAMIVAAYQCHFTIAADHDATNADIAVSTQSLALLPEAVQS